MPQTTRGWRERLAVVLGCLSARCGEAGRAASWNLVAEESSSVRADACSRRVVGALIKGAK